MAIAGLVYSLKDMNRIIRSEIEVMRNTIGTIGKVIALEKALLNDDTYTLEEVSKELSGRMRDARAEFHGVGASADGMAKRIADMVLEYPLILKPGTYFSFWQVDRDLAASGRARLWATPVGLGQISKFGDMAQMAPINKASEIEIKKATDPLNNGVYTVFSPPASGVISLTQVLNSDTAEDTTLEVHVRKMLT